MDLSGRKILVTGAGTGIGRSVAIHLAGQGADIAVHYSHSDDGAVSAVDEIRAMGRRASALHADLGDVEQALRLPNAAAEVLGGLDGVINNAGITMNMAFQDTTPEQFDTLFNVNIRGMFFVSQSATRIMVPNAGGTIVNISSVHAYTAMVEPDHYVRWRSDNGHASHAKLSIACRCSVRQRLRPWALATYRLSLTSTAVKGLASN